MPAELLNVEFIMANGERLLALALIGYLLGSVPFGLLAARAAGLGDIRKIGSGNIGATNVLRTGNKLAALITLVGDGGKGALAVLIARHFAGDGGAVIAGLTSFLGHLFPVWLKFKGGKGVATFLGTNLALYFPGGLAACAIWLATAKFSRYSSLSALAAAAATPFVLLATGRGEYVLLVLALAALVFWKHAANIRRLLDGTEPKIGKTKPAANGGADVPTTMS